MADLTDTEVQQVVEGLTSLCELRSEMNGVLWDALNGEFDDEEEV